MRTKICSQTMLQILNRCRLFKQFTMSGKQELMVYGGLYLRGLTVTEVDWDMSKAVEYDNFIECCLTVKVFSIIILQKEIDYSLVRYCYVRLTFLLGSILPRPAGTVSLMDDDDLIVKGLPQLSAICVTISRRYMLEEAIKRIGGTIHAFKLTDDDDTTGMASVKINLQPHSKSMLPTQ
ncbi:uncharacterized protein [Triticum aestivum]|uniref:uncharacterized protein isoform X1 n=1 Tax=Triticum aestivum TaxID=4565 RepID=UPI0003D48A48|nr:uncharacterized protein LOC123097459 isoform X1 [Triticum aestivum]